MGAIKIEVHTHDRDLISDVLERSSISSGDELAISDQAKIRYEGSYIRKALGFPEIVYFTITFASSVSAGIIANWLYDKFKKKNIEKLIIERTEIEINQEKITKIIEKITMIEK
jgi:hypothetical protein